MVYYIVNNKGVVIARSTVANMDPEEYDAHDIKERMSDLDIVIKSSIGDYRNVSNESSIMQEIDKNDIEC